ncbi:phytanoyl-CoA dioxygenase family protein [Actinoallomurus spadix]|uniref:Phytanoyl-CoA dioxygenase n=1 Tax=Actinoallomurus spadix TaxID=79912 RepID=A0ABP3GBK6_9ACTN|nr:phytanoyl-CoA dioxygenase family protein [Actinoallomurus spadix]MCO5984538.1 phytanoyl-CoA dioxygenase family protein [Actinoallomurus spadix]
MSSPQRVARFRFTGTVGADERAFYERHGFLIYRNVFGEQDIQVIKEDAERLERDTLQGKIPAEHRDVVLEPSYDEDGKPSLHRLPYFTLYSPRTRDLVERRGLDALGPGLLGRPAWRFEDVIDGSVWQMKRAKRTSYNALDWHLDFPHDHPVAPLVNVGIYLDAATTRNGCLVVVPGSHRFPPRRLDPLGLPLVVEPGDVICHTNNILHHSGRVLDDTCRATLYLYYAAGERPAAGTTYTHTAGEQFATLFTDASPESEEALR